MIITPKALTLQLDDAMEHYYCAKKAKAMSSYLKGQFKFHGIQSPQRKQIQKEWFTLVKKAQHNPWLLVELLWDKEQREYQYVAIDALKKLTRRDFHIDDIYKIEQLITTKSWWDTVDSLASNPLAVYFQQFPEQILPVVEEWRYDENLWLNRSCLIFQLKYKDAVDFELLKSLVIQYQHVPEFFIQKAIGWSLRQYSKYNPEGVRTFITEVELSGLAKREASKYI